MKITELEGEKMVVRKNDAVDYTILLLIYLQLVILEFFGFGKMLNKIITSFILARVLFMKGKQWQYGLLYATGLFILYFLSVLLGDSIKTSNALSNFLMQLYPAVYTYYIVFLCRNRPNIIDNCLEKGFWVFNFTMIINIVVLLIQIFIPYSINAVIADSKVISYYEDTISGLFRYASTHVVCLFTIFIVLYDISCGNQLKRKRFKILITMLVTIMIAISLFIAANNDNKAFFLFLPLFLFAYWFAGDMKLARKILKIELGILIVSLILIVLYAGSNSIKKFIDTNFLKIFNTILEARNMGVSANGSSERIAILSYAISKGGTWITGTGFGSSYIYSGGYFGFKHFGQADLGSILVLGGIWYTILFFVYYLKCFSIIVGQVSLRNKRPLKWSILAIIISVAVYTQCFTRTNIMSTLILIMFAFRTRCYDERRKYQIKLSSD